MGTPSRATSARADDAERMVRFALERCGRLDVLVNNAGGQYFVPAEAIEPKGWRAVTRLNVGGTELMSRTAAELAFRPQGSGTIVNVTLSPHHGLPGMTHSSAARAAVEGLTRALAREWRDDGVAVLAVAAGHFDTQSLRKYPERGLEGGGADGPAAAARARAGARVARGARCVAARARALRLGRDARRRARQLVRAVAAGDAHRGRRRGPDGGTAAASAPLSVAARASASAIPSASSVPSVVPVAVGGDPPHLLRRLAHAEDLDHVAAALERARARRPARRLGHPAPLPDQPRDAQRHPHDGEQDQGIEERHRPPR